MKNNSYFNRVLVTSGDLDFPAAGLPLYTVIPGRNFKTRKLYNTALAVGQPVLWLDPVAVGDVPLTTVTANITAVNIGNVHIGVAHSAGKNGTVDSIREASYGDLGGCSIEKLGAYAARCGSPQIKALYPKCLHCDSLSLKITVDDNESKSFMPLRKAQDHVINYTPNCKVCDSCDRTPTCDEYICGLIDKVNDYASELTLAGDPYPGPQARTVDKRFRAVKLHSGTGQFLSYCITPTNGTCVDCDRIDDLTTFTVNSVVKNFVGVTDPADATKTLVSQLEEAALQIEEAFEDEYGRHAGFVVLSRGLGDCCGIQLHISTCDPNFVIAGLTPCAGQITPFPTFTTSSYCEDCAQTSTPTTPTCGMAIIADQFHIDCGCYPADVPNLPFTDVRIEVIDNGQVLADNFDTSTLQEGAIAANYGTQVQWREYNQQVSGEGFDFLEGNNYSGHLGLPDKNSKINNIITAKCETSYCTYWLKSIVSATTFVRPETRPMRTFGEINVPEGDTTTKTAIEGLFTKVVAVNPQVCSSLVAATC
jgi:hypothetical protein